MRTWSTPPARKKDQRWDWGTLFGVLDDLFFTMSCICLGYGVGWLFFPVSVNHLFPGFDPVAVG
jgi:hypothetical protein